MSAQCGRNRMNDLFLAYALIVIGLLLMAAELFLPTGGIVLVLGVGGVIAGIAIAFNQSSAQGIVTLIVVVILVPLLGPVLMHYWPRTAMGKKFLLEGPDDDATVAEMPVNLELEQLRGRYGKALSPLRPSGVADFDGRRVDVLSEGTMIDVGQWVKVIDVKAARVVVRQVDRPPDLGEIDTSGLS
jgi:membrane-bound ClpP family serine protease